MKKIHRIPTEYGKLYSCVYGDISAKNAVPLLTVHGGPGYCSDSLTVLSDLSEQCPVIVYDQLGCGLSDNPNNPKTWCLEYYLGELQQVINYYGLVQYDLLGHSWGGALASSFAVKQPEGLRRLILSSPLISSPDWMRDTQKRKQELPKEIQETIQAHEAAGTTNSEAYQQAVRIFNANFLCRLDPKPELLVRAFDKFNLDIYFHMWGSSEFNATGSLKDFSQVENLSKISVRTLLLSGFYDEILPETMAYYCKLIKNGQQHVFNESAHAPMLEQREEYLSVIAEFLQA